MMARLILCGIVSLLACSLVIGQQVTYIYDELGRLVGVIDPNGEAATYEYDAVGNILSISRYGTEELKIIEFTPDKGPDGTQVTIYGKGFSTTPSQNDVTFHDGQTASVVTASATELVVTVPLMAETGTIQVTVGAASDISTDSFFVAPLDFPTITDIDPPAASQGDPVTITGTNFEPSPGPNVVGFNISRAEITSATGTTIQTTVPTPSGSGILFVATPAGTAVATEDFFVPPGSLDPNNLEFKGRMIIDGPVNTDSVTVGTSGMFGMTLFDGLGGQRKSLEITNNTIPGCTYIDIYDTQGALLTSGVSICTSTGFQDTVGLQRDGSYEIVTDPSGSTATGSATLTLYEVPENIGAISLDTAQFISITVPGENAVRTFTSGVQGISVQGTNVTIGSGINCGGEMFLYDPNGTQVGYEDCVRPADGAWIDTVSLPATGEYTVLVDPSTTTLGDITLTVHSVQDDTGSISPEIAETTVLTIPGQNGIRTFSGYSCHLISLDMTNITIDDFNCGIDVLILDPSWNTIASKTCVTAPSDFIDQVELTQNGTYTILVNPEGPSIGDMTLTLHDVQGENCGGGGPKDPPIHVQRFENHHPEFAWIAMILGAWGI